MIESNPRSDRLLTAILLGLALILVVLQLSSLFIFPQPNSLRWFGDETWLMSEAKQQIATGTVRYPLAIGSMLEHGKGLVLSMTWLSAVLYGLPAIVVATDPIAVGRIVTALCAVILTAVLFVGAKKMGATSFAAAVATLLLVCSRSFFFSSHSARPDVLAGLIVLLFVVYCTLLTQHERQRSGAWWATYGAAVTFLAVSSSIHLLTLLIPVAIFFAWRFGVLAKATNFTLTVSGALAVLALLIIAYYVANPDLSLFTSGAGHTQFHDVLQSIPALRPFSRSVQMANILIRVKQILAEAPSILLLPILVPFLPRSWWRKGQHTVSIAVGIVSLSWLLFQGAEINYLIHILPLLFFALALLLSNLRSTATSRWALASISVIFALFSFRDALFARNAAQTIDDSNSHEINNIRTNIKQTWHGNIAPRVIAEPPALDRLSQDTNITTITDHFISFSTRVEPIDSFFARQRIDYVVLYNSPTYPKNRPENDPFYQAVERSGSLILSQAGKSGDVGRDYFHPSPWQDTLLLFQLRNE